MPDVSPFRYAGFFWIQGVCVLIEVFTEYVLMGLKEAELLGKSRWSGLVRTVWILGVLYFTAPLINGVLVQVAVRTGAQAGGPISFTRLVVGHVHSWVVYYSRLVVRMGRGNFGIY